jgi:hypothetical protein
MTQEEKDFIDSLPEESGCEVNFTTKRENLEEEFYRFIDEEEGIPKMCNTRECIAWGVDIASHFAEWQENKNAAQSCKNLYAAIKENQEKKFFNDDFEKASYAQGMIDGSMWYKQQMNQAKQDFLEKAEEFLYLQLNNGLIECGNIERLIDDFKNYIQNE